MFSYRKFYIIESYLSIKVYGYFEMSSFGSGGVFFENNQKFQRSEVFLVFLGRKNFF